MRRRENASTTRCYLCPEPIVYERTIAGGRFVFRGEQHVICERCRGRYWRAVEQASQFGKRYPFFERRNMPPKFERGALFTQMFHILSIAHDRQILRQKEVNWMVKEQTEKMLKLPGRIAAVVGQTYAVCGDDFKLADDEALMRIRDLLDDIDPAIMQRVKKKKRAS